MSTPFTYFLASTLIFVKGEQNMYSIFEQLCQKYNVTSYKISKETGISQTTLSNWKSGKITPKTDKLQLIADYFGVTIEYLMGKEENGETAYYLNDETKERLQMLKVNDKLRILFDASRKLEPSDIDFVLEVIERIKKERH
jgi:transcriptional regulator with XRE-family HTH domain